MKKHLTKKGFWHSLLSVLILGIFILFAVGSILDEWAKYEVEDLGNGMLKETDHLGNSETTSYTGRRDDKGRWQGPLVIINSDPGLKSGSTETVVMVNGVRHGESIFTTRFDYYNPPHVQVKHYKYNMGHLIEGSDNKGVYSRMAEIPSFKILGNKYPWFLLTLNVFGFDTAYVESYMGDFETKLNAYTYDVTKFDDYYGDINDELEETPYDSIITFNSKLTVFQGLAAMKNSEFRLAIIDHYRSTGSTTFNIISTTYPGYLLTLNAKGVNNEDFKVFCQDMDSRMTSYGVLNQQDPFFIDSVDARMFRAILAILNAGKSFSLSEEPSDKSILQDYKTHDINDIYDEIMQKLNPSFSKSTPKEVGNLVLIHMFEEYYIPEEIIRQAVMEAYFNKGGVKRVPIATTVFENNNSATSATLQGYVIEDGGATVTSRGIAWATFYAPTKNDNPVNSGTGTGTFNVTLNGLTPGTTYYARTFATNSSGTAYGNTVSFVASITTDVNDIEILKQDFTIYPNPASSLTTFSFQVESPESIMLTIIDMKGKVVLNKDLGNLPQGENHVMLNLSLLQNGIYICKLTNGTTKVTQKLIISH